MLKAFQTNANRVISLARFDQQVINGVTVGFEKVYNIKGDLYLGYCTITSNDISGYAFFPFSTHVFTETSQSLAAEYVPLTQSAGAGYIPYQSGNWYEWKDTIVNFGNTAQTLPLIQI